jgi:hypothetical protein
MRRASTLEAVMDVTFQICASCDVTIEDELRSDMETILKILTGINQYLLAV